MTSANSLLDRRDFLGASHKLAEVGKAIGADGDGEEDVEDGDKSRAFDALREEYAATMEKLHREMGREWESRLQVS